MALGTVGYKSLIADTSANPSGAIWADCPIWGPSAGGISAEGYGFFDDFDKFLTETVTTVAPVGSFYQGFATAGAIADAASAGGAIALTTTTDNHAQSMRLGNAPFIITGLPTTSGKLWFEARVKLTSAANTHSAVVVGLNTLTTLATAHPLSSANPPVPVGSGIMFYRLEADGDYWDTATIDNTTVAIIGSDAVAITADTYVKLGIVYDPTLSAKNIKFYANGIELADGVTNATIVAKTTLDTVCLCPTIGHVAGASGATDAVTMDWWGCYQLRV